MIFCYSIVNSGELILWIVWRNLLTLFDEEFFRLLLLDVDGRVVVKGVQYDDRVGENVLLVHFIEVAWILRPIS